MSAISKKRRWKFVKKQSWKMILNSSLQFKFMLFVLLFQINKPKPTPRAFENSRKMYKTRAAGECFLHFPSVCPQERVRLHVGYTIAYGSCTWNLNWPIKTQHAGVRNFKVLTWNAAGIHETQGTFNSSLRVLRASSFIVMYNFHCTFVLILLMWTKMGKKRPGPFPKPWNEVGKDCYALLIGLFFTYTLYLSFLNT